MARYIDADKLKKLLLTISVVSENLYGMGFNRGLDRAGTAIDMMPAADVAPKNEVEELKVRLELEQKAHESLKELYRIDTDALVEARRKTEVEVAREIFEEIERMLDLNTFQGDIFTGKYFDVELATDIAELKKKYTEDINHEDKD